MYDIIIIGAGTAGLSAAIYGLRAGKTVLVLEEKSYGGQIVNTPEVCNYPGIKNISGYEFATNLYEQALNLGAKVVYERAEGIVNSKDVKKVLTSTGEYEGGSVIIATGAKNRPLGLPGEKELIGAGVSYCATCDGAFFRGRDVAVAGGGNTALEDALFLSNYCNRVYLIHRRNEFRGEKKLVAKIGEKDNIELIMDSKVVALEGEEHLKGITIESVKTGKKYNLKVDGLFVAIGQMPANEAFGEIIDLDDLGYVCATEDCTTKTEGIFTAGDCRTKSVRQLTTAASDGAIAGLRASEYVG